MPDLNEGVNCASPVERSAVTFMLPVLNRKGVIIRAIESCLACQSSTIVPHVLVVDGGSIDGTDTLVMQKFGDDPRVRMIRQPADRPGFQHAAWFAVDFVDTPLATYMYSDDLVSPHFVRMVEALAAAPDVSIALGYGRQVPEGDVLCFDVVDSVERVDTERVLDAYYGKVARVDGKSMPVSPVCCVVRSSVLRDWVREAQRFANERPLRRHAMIRLAGGPDLMIFLYALLCGGRQALRANGVLGQLTVTSGSITEAGNREAQLTVGYWLGRVWGFQEALRTGRQNLAGRFGGYLVAVWLYIMLTKLRRREFSWMLDLIDELKDVLRALRDQRIMFKAIGACVASLLARIQMVIASKRGPGPTPADQTAT